MVNSEIYITHKSEQRFSQQNEIQNLDLNGDKTKSHKLNHKCFSSHYLVKY